MTCLWIRFLSFSVLKASMISSITWPAYGLCSCPKSVCDLIDPKTCLWILFLQISILKASVIFYWSKDKLLDYVYGNCTYLIWLVLASFVRLMQILESFSVLKASVILLIQWHAYGLFLWWLYLFNMTCLGVFRTSHANSRVILSPKSVCDLIDPMTCLWILFTS